MGVLEPLGRSPLIGFGCWEGDGGKIGNRIGALRRRWQQGRAAWEEMAVGSIGDLEICFLFFNLMRVYLESGGPVVLRKLVDTFRISLVLMSVKNLICLTWFWNENHKILLDSPV